MALFMTHVGHHSPRQKTCIWIWVPFIYSCKGAQSPPHQEPTRQLRLRALQGEHAILTRQYFSLENSHYTCHCDIRTALVLMNVLHTRKPSHWRHPLQSPEKLHHLIQKTSWVHYHIQRALNFHFQMCEPSEHVPHLLHQCNHTVIQSPWPMSGITVRVRGYLSCFWRVQGQDIDLGSGVQGGFQVMVSSLGVRSALWVHCSGQVPVLCLELSGSGSCIFLRDQDT